MGQSTFILVLWHFKLIACVCNKYNVQRLFRLVRNRSHEAVQTLGTKQTAKNVTTENEHTKQV